MINTSPPRVLGGPATWEPSIPVAWTSGEPSWERAATPDCPQWPDATPAHGEAAAAAVAGGIWSDGPATRAAERRLRRLGGARHALAVNTGAAALLTAYDAVRRVRGAPEGAEVVMPASTFAATATEAERAGLTPVVVDVDPATLVVTPEAIKDAITPKTCALVAVPLYDACPDLGQIAAIGKRRSLAFIIDAAHAPFATWEGVGLPHLADATIHSYQDSKVATCGEGGAVLTNDPAIASCVIQGRNCGRTPSDRPGWWSADEPRSGWNLRMPEASAALLGVGLDAYESQMATREAAYARFLDLLRAAPLPATPTHRDPRATGVIYKTGLRLALDVPVPVLRIALARQLTVEVAAPYVPLGAPGSLWMGDASPHPNADKGRAEMLLLPHEFWLRKSAPEDLHAALAVLTAHQEDLSRYADAILRSGYDG